MKVYQFRLTGDLYLMKIGKKKTRIVCGEILEWYIDYNFDLFAEWSDLMGEL